jgi:hypothetical protein
MYNVNDLMERLRNGESIEDIGNEFASLMTEASKQYAEEQEAERAAKAKREKEAALKDVYAQELADAFNAYVKFLTPTLFEESEPFDAKDVAETLDGILSFASAFVPLKDRVKVRAQKIDQSADEVLADFLNKFGW